MTLLDLGFSATVILFITLGVLYGGKILGGESNDVRKP